MQLYSQIPEEWRPYCQCSPLTWALIEQGITSSEVATDVYPAAPLRFNALKLTKPSEVKVVILGQDPYPTPGDAHGLAFSSLSPKVPKSLQNIFKELAQDCGVARSSADLTDWALQGVLLLNSYLTVEKGTPGSHAKIGWGDVTDGIIRELSQRQKHVVFMLWGASAKSKKSLIDPEKHLILESVHPSPLSARSGFFGNRHFSKANTYLLDKGRVPVVW